MRTPQPTGISIGGFLSGYPLPSVGFSCGDYVRQSLIARLAVAAAAMRALFAAVACAAAIMEDLLAVLVGQPPGLLRVDATVMDETHSGASGGAADRFPAKGAA
jgi:hypothetical protein